MGTKKKSVYRIYFADKEIKVEASLEDCHFTVIAQ